MDIQNRMVKFQAQADPAVTINACPGHFATGNSHTNFYIDVSRVKMRLNEAREAAKTMCGLIKSGVDVVDTIVCLDGTEVLGACLADKMEKSNIRTVNKHETMYIVSPEENSMHQYIFRDNNRMAIEGKNVLILVDTTSTGSTVKRVIECVRYYGGNIAGISAIFSVMDKIDGVKVFSLFTADDIPGYKSFPSHDCPMCASHQKIDAMVNGYGYSSLR